MKDKLIIRDPAIKLGRPVLAGTRVTVDEVLGLLAEGKSAEEVIAARPGVTEAGIRAALRLGAEAVLEDSPLGKQPPLELHGAHAVELPNGEAGSGKPAIAVRAYLPEADQAAVRRLPPPPEAGRAWIPALDPAGAEPAAPFPPEPMERIHPAGVFEALFPGETEPFPYRLEVGLPGGETRPVESAYGLPASLTSSELPVFSGADGAEADPGECRLHEVLGARITDHAGVAGVAFAVWAPNASSVSVVGGFNGWDGFAHPMRPVGPTGVWELFVPGVGAGELYKFRITSGADGRAFDKADPFALAAEKRPATASIVWKPGGFPWGDAEWIAARAERQALDKPMAIYEVHLGSWKRAPGADARWLNYRELADQLVPYVKEMGYTHIEPMPLQEHPYDGSWGYQVTGYFAPTSRYGTPDDFRYFVDRAHRAGLGVILDWVPGHFPRDAHGLCLFDGTPLYEHADPRRSENREWGTLSFNLERGEVAAFLLSNAVFWIEQYHVDGLRIDAVSSMIYLDYSRQHWLPNELGGRENLEAAAFFRRLNALVHRKHPGVLTIAEESTAWPHVTDRGHEDSLGFDLKWNLGWMHDTLGYAGRDPVHRRHHHNELTFSLVYAFTENFLLPFSHDEVVHGKRSMLAKMPGDEWQRFATLRLVYGYMTAHPGKKLHFMGSEFGPEREWSEGTELDWSLLDRPRHRGLQAWVRDLNRLYSGRPALHERDFGWDGFQWIDCDDAERSIVTFLRRGNGPGECVVVAANFTPVVREGYRLGVPGPGLYVELLNSDDAGYGGSGVRNAGPLAAEAQPGGSQPCSVLLTLPPLGIVILGRRPAGDEPPLRDPA